MFEFFSNLGLPENLSQDFILLLIILLGGFLLGMFIGRHRVVSLLINIYVSYAVVSFLPSDFFPEGVERMIIFFLLVAILTIFGEKLFDIYISGSGTSFLWKVFVLSFLEVILIISIAVTFWGEDSLRFVSENSFEILTASWIGFACKVAPLIFLFLIHKKIHR